MVVMVMDGQGGGIGSAVIKGLRQDIGHELMILSLGTNSAAASRMMKAGANRGASGENAIVHTCPKVDVIIGPLSIVMPNSMMGEVTTAMSEAVCSSRAKKLLIPLTQENITLVGTDWEPLPHLVDETVRLLKEEIARPPSLHR